MDGFNVVEMTLILMMQPIQFNVIADIKNKSKIMSLDYFLGHGHSSCKLLD